MSKNAPQSSEVVVTFTGGLGAQIFSAAIYFYLKSEGRNVYADLDYFQQQVKTATVGNKGEISHWAYELDAYGMPLEGFSTKKIAKSFFKRNRPEIIADGAVKVGMAIEALRHQDVRRLFPVKQSIIDECIKVTGGNDYLCIHIRRGDYVNVASHLVSDAEFIDLAKSLSGFVSTVVVLSDSEVTSEIRDNLSKLFAHCSYVVGGDMHIAHALIRRANYLICSNSQFSLSAALLNEVGQQIFLPTKWFGDGDAGIQVPINALCSFQLLSLN